MYVLITFYNEHQQYGINLENVIPTVRYKQYFQLPRKNVYTSPKIRKQ